MNKEQKAIELLEKAQDHAKDKNIKKLDSIDSKQTYKWIMQDMFSCIDQAIALLKQPECETCNDKIPDFCSNPKHFKPAEKPPTSEIEAIEIDKMSVSELVAKYESSHNAITVLKRKLREAYESDDWMKKATEYYQDGGCPICFSTDEAGCTEGCYLGQLQARLDKAEAERKLLDERFTMAAGFDEDREEIIKQQGIVIIDKDQRIKELKALRDTVQISCNPPDDCNDPVVLKTYMKGCFDEAMKL